MVRIAYLMLCHRDPDGVAETARMLVSAGDRVAIHLDRRASRQDFTRLRSLLADVPGVVLVARRVPCGWGDWSLVRATIAAARAALAAFDDATHFFLISGDCMPIRPACDIRARLAGADADYIESVDFHDAGWIQTGLRDERLVYRHPFNERRHRTLFYAALAIQKRLGLRRRPPRGLRIMIGSQWWCLRRQTLERILSFLGERPDIRRFFATTWIPDEICFQTLVRHLVPRREILSRAPTFLMFTDYGMPVTFHDDHFDFLTAQEPFFARKISPAARTLRDRLGRHYGSGPSQRLPDADGRALIRFTSRCGREGRRYAPRAWDLATAGDRETQLIVCKNWHLGRRIADTIAGEVDGAACGYVFDEENVGLPDLGGLENGMNKRWRHRRAFVDLLVAACGRKRLVLCLDPSRHELARDLVDGGATRVLEVACAFDTVFLRGHAQRVGLLGEGIDAEPWRDTMDALRRDLDNETERFRRSVPEATRLRENARVEENALPLAEFLSIPVERARRILSAERLLAD